MHAHEQLAAPGRGRLDVDDLEHVGSTIFETPNGFHTPGVPEANAFHRSEREYFGSQRALRSRGQRTWEGLTPNCALNAAANLLGLA